MASNWEGSWADNGWPIRDQWQSATTVMSHTPVISGTTVASAVKELELQKRDRIIQDYIDRTRMWQTEGEMLPFKELVVVSCEKDHSRYGEQIVIEDRLTGKYYQIFRDFRNDVRKYKMDKNAFRVMDYKVKLYDEMNKWVTADYGTESTKKEDPTCKSCKEKHPVEKLDVIGRCSKKLASHNAKLRKLYWAHKNK